VYFSTCARCYPMIPANDSQQTTTSGPGRSTANRRRLHFHRRRIVKGTRYCSTTQHPKTTTRNDHLFSDGEQNTPPIRWSIEPRSPPPLPVVFPSLRKLARLMRLSPKSARSHWEISARPEHTHGNIGNARSVGRNQHVLGTAASPDLTCFFAQHSKMCSRRQA